MKLPEKKYEVETNIVGKDISFRISNNAVMFEILRSKLYEDPIGSICREISSNARDANREAGNEDKPIEIWIPGEYYVLKDSGPGISPSRMENVYCVFGESTKRKSNEETGGYGLGAKCPFSITDQFTILTVYESVSYMYSAFIDETGIGKVKLVSSKPTDEPSGTTIKIPIKPTDIKDFTEKTYYYTQHWNPQPIYYGGFKIDQLEPLIKTKNWILYPKDSKLQFNCLCDYIPYKFGSYTENWRGKRRQRSYLKIPPGVESDDDVTIPMDLVLKFKTGDVEISANREKLQISEETKNVIKEKVTLFNIEYTKVIEKKIKEEKNILDVLKILNNRYVKSQEWTWNNETFTYPTTINTKNISIGELDSPVNNDLVLYNGENRGYYKRSPLQETKIEYFDKVAFVIFDKEEEEYTDRYGDKVVSKRFTTYDKGKITALLKLDYEYVYILKEGILPRLEPCFNLTELRAFEYDEGTRKLKPKIRKKREPKTKIRVRTRRYDSWNYEHIEWDTENEVVYTKEDLMKLFPHQGIGPVKVYELTAKIKTPKLGPNWIEWEDYLKREVYNKLLTEQRDEIFIAIDLSEGLLNRMDRYDIKKLDFLKYTVFFKKWGVNETTLRLLKHLRDKEKIKFDISKITQRYTELLDEYPILHLLQQADSYMEITKELTAFINGHFSKNRRLR